MRLWLSPWICVSISFWSLISLMCWWRAWRCKALCSLISSCSSLVRFCNLFNSVIFSNKAWPRSEVKGPSVPKTIWKHKKREDDRPKASAKHHRHGLVWLRVELQRFPPGSNREEPPHPIHSSSVASLCRPSPSSLLLLSDCASPLSPTDPKKGLCQTHTGEKHLSWDCVSETEEEDLLNNCVNHLLQSLSALLLLC